MPLRTSPVRGAFRIATFAAVGVTTTLALAACAERDDFFDHPLAVVVDGGAPAEADDRADITGARISGDYLHLDVVFPGGCAPHDFALYQSGVFRESNPVQTDLQLTHANNDDPCDGIVHRGLIFDLGPLAQLYRSAYATETGTLDIYLAAPGGGQVNPPSVRYSF